MPHAHYRLGTARRDSAASSLDFLPPASLMGVSTPIPHAISGSHLSRAPFRSPKKCPGKPYADADSVKECASTHCDASTVVLSVYSSVLGTSTSPTETENA
ncbi:hypothetical protein LshimejAT787_0400440 [Lyophyllum shimeji]|uniref:Uncharacterized protein n=1 Tax=Lyophyllum shimeji TaxID=47721 RepID=A0A9P3PK78_LYOSH|nr:hypothetical protein LshimejAT787_0400440 [Lyophyllum shimeji]